jgi:hypothetical protein
MVFRDRLRWLNPFHRECETIRTEVAPTECLVRLREAVVSRYSPRTWWLFTDGTTPVIGGVTDTKFWMRRTHNLARPLSLPQAAGVVMPSGAGSAVQICIGMKRSNAILLVLVAVIVLVQVILIAQLVPNSIGLVLLWLIVGIGVNVFDQLLFAPDVVFLRQFIAEVVSPQPAWRPYASRTG